MHRDLSFGTSLCLWVGLLAFGFPAFPAGDRALLPREGFAAGWVRDGSPKVYEGEALYDHIDGGGEVFLELGFEACTVQRYRKGRDEFAFEVYRMADDAAALGVYLSQCGRETPDPDLAERHTVGRNQLLLVKGRFYVVATSPEASPGLPAVLVAAARAAAAAMPSAAAPACLGWLPKEGLDPRSVRIVRGPIGLQALVTLGEGDVLLLDRRVTAVAGDYLEKDGSTRALIVAQYPTEAAAAAALRHLAQGLDPRFEALATGERRLVVKDHEGRYGFGVVEGPRLTLQLGLPSAPSP